MTDALTDVLAYFPFVAPFVFFLAMVGVWRWRWRDYAFPVVWERQRPIAETGCEEGLNNLSLDTYHSQKGKIAVILPCRNQGDYLERNLPIILEQSYSAFEVVVVDMASSDSTSDVLKRLEGRYNNLRHTFVPPTARFADTLRLAVVLGVRSARAEWVMLMQPDCEPVSNRWLELFSEYFNDSADLIIGYSNFIDNGKRYTRRAIYNRLRYQLQCFRAAWSGKAIGGEEVNLCIRKKCFLEQTVLLENRPVFAGENCSLVDLLAYEGRTALLLHPDAVVMQEIPLLKVLHGEELRRMKAHPFMSSRRKMYQWRERMASGAAFLLLLIGVLYLVVRIVQSIQEQAYAPVYLFTDIPMCLFIVLSFMLPVMSMKRGTAALRERSFGMRVLWYDAFQPLHRWLLSSGSGNRPQSTSE